jgi:hypothetical protein
MINHGPQTTQGFTGQMFVHDVKSTWYGLRSEPPIEQGPGYNYPPMPLPSVLASNNGNGLPRTPGIYFLLLENGVVDYVGQSIKLSTRVRLRSHHILEPHHQIAYLSFHEHELDWAEQYYIGKHRPMRNGGEWATHRKYDSPAYGVESDH